MNKRQRKKNIIKTLPYTVAKKLKPNEAMVIQFDMNDDNFDESYTRKVIYSFLNHEYEKNGRGGLFTIPNCQYDMRTVEIWTQFMWYLSIVGK